jgi:hypothetical protein
MEKTIPYKLQTRIAMSEEQVKIIEIKDLLTTIRSSLDNNKQWIAYVSDKNLEARVRLHELRSKITALGLQIRESGHLLSNFD